MFAFATAVALLILVDCFEHLQGTLPEKMAAAELGKDVEGRHAGLSFAPSTLTSGESWMTTTNVCCVSVARQALTLTDPCGPDSDLSCRFAFQIIGDTG